MDLIEWLRAQLAEDEQVARACILDNGGGRWVLDRQRAYSAPALADQGVRIVGGWAGALPHIAAWDPARVLAEVKAKRAILDEHAFEWQHVEWPHDQDGKGKAQVCRRCQNAEHTEWHPPFGHAGVLPQGFVAPYVLAPCATVSLLAQPYAGREGWRDEWSVE